MGEKAVILIMSISIFLLIIISVVSAGWFEELKKTISGKATQPVTLNISVGGPQIRIVYNTTLGLSDGPNEATSTNITVNFTVYTAAGTGNLNHSTATANVSKSGETTRGSVSCSMFESEGNYANYTCNVTMYWWDGTGTWDITAYIEDNESNSAQNTSTDFYIGERTSFVMSPSTLNWSSIAPGATNRTSNNHPIVLNNTGNDVINAGDIQLNSSNLRGETTSTEALWAGNFSVSNETGGAACSGAACTECGGTTMVNATFTGIAAANLPNGNYTINDGTGQEQLYFCLRLAGTELSDQAYSTANETEGSWTIKIV